MKLLKPILALLAVLLLPLHAAAEDIDLFAWANKSSTGSANVLFILDNGANFSASVSSQRCSITSDGVVDTSGSGSAPTNLDGTAGAVEQCALYSVVKALATSGTSVTLNIGVMVFNAGGFKTFDAAANTFSNYCDPAGTGGCLLMKMTAFNATVQTNMLSWIRNWAISGNSNYVMKGNNTANGASMQEAWAFYNGKTGVSGKDYSSDRPTGGCGNNYVIFVGNAYRNNSTPGDGTNEGSSPYKPLWGLSLTSAKNASPAATSTEKNVINDTITTSCGTATLQTDEGKGIYALNWARYMKDNAVAKTYAVGVLGPTCNSEYASHLSKLGSTEVGGGRYFGTSSYSDLVVALQTVLTEILSVNSVFSSVSLPSSVNTQGSYLNQVFIGMFRPDDTFSPRWMGNLKQYQLGYFNGVLQTLDADHKIAINTNTGFITECARSFWTPTALDSYWLNYSKKGGCTAVSNSEYSNYPDGNMVEKGGAAYRLRAGSPGSRTVKTCSAGMSSGSLACSSLLAFSTTNVSQAQLDSTSTVSAATLISWATGTNTQDELDKGTTVMRPSAHGDIVHSRPVPVNHGASDANPQIVVYYGANDGLLHAINGDQTQNIVSGSTTYAPGDELWSFMPPEFYGNVKRLYDNSPAISYPQTTVATAKPKAYGMDGPLTSLKTVISNTNKTYVYATMRRGGRAVYAFDVTTPTSPSLLWKKGCDTSSLTDTNCSSGMSDIGQTWGAAKTLYALNYNSGYQPLIIIGGGYDTCEDYDAQTAGGANHNCSSSSKGGKVYILDAVTGAVVRSFDTEAPVSGTGVKRGVVADAAIINSGGQAQYAYLADLGGNVYRISFSGNNTSAWSMTRIASLGCATTASCTANRKFMFTPSVVPSDTNITSSTTMYILLGSGDREKPVTYYTAAGAVSNYFFMIEDKPGDASWLSSENSNCGASLLCLASLQAVTSTTSPPTAAQLASKKGWYLSMRSTEQVVTSALTVYGTTYFSTHTPAVITADACSTNLGTTRLYTLDYTNASGTVDLVTGGGLPPSPVFANVLVSNHDYGTGGTVGGGAEATTSVSVCVSGCDKTSPEQAKPVTGNSSTQRHKSRLYWFLNK